jgi:ABC-type oligopeptide transport system ATPase subunit
MIDSILSVENLKVAFHKTSFPFMSHKTIAVNDVSFELLNGECLAIVGESGSGKSTVARSIAGLQGYEQGHIAFNQEQLQGIHPEIQMIFQDPHGSLNPRMTLLDSVCEPMEQLMLKKSKKDRIKRAEELMEKVGLETSYLKRYPHALSGGQKQRVGIARALASCPKVLICDEPVSALDVSIQAQVLNLLKSLQKEMHLSLLFISHDLSVVRFIADRVIVMQKGKIVEENETEELIHNPKYLYTQDLINSVPEMESDIGLTNRLD